MSICESFSHKPKNIKATYYIYDSCAVQARPYSWMSTNSCLYSYADAETFLISHCLSYNLCVYAGIVYNYSYISVDINLYGDSEKMQITIIFF